MSSVWFYSLAMQRKKSIMLNVCYRFEVTYELSWTWGTQNVIFQNPATNWATLLVQGTQRLHCSDWCHRKTKKTSRNATKLKSFLGLCSLASSDGLAWYFSMNGTFLNNKKTIRSTAHWRKRSSIAWKACNKFNFSDGASVTARRGANSTG